MRLARKLTFLLLLGIVAVFVVHTALSIRSHIELYGADVRRDERVMGRVLAGAIATAWKDQGAIPALALLDAAGERESNVSVRWVPLPGEGRDGTPDPDVLAKLYHQDQATFLRDEPVRGRVIYTYTGVHLRGELIGAVELSEPLSQERYLYWRVQRQLVTAGAMVVVCGLLSWIVGARVVGRPIQRLVAKARRIGAGDFSDPLVLDQQDELADLAHEMNTMAERLEGAARRVAEETEARVDAVEQLRHADRLTAVGQLAAGIAHELGTPLNVVAGRAKMVVSGEASDPEEIRQIARIIGEQTERITRIVRQLLDFARRRPAEKQVTDLRVLVGQTVALLRPLAAQKGLELDLDPADAPVEAKLDASQIQQTLTNIAMNAFQASSAGGRIQFRVLSARRRHPRQRFGPELPCALVEVQDEGSGIAPDVLSKVFDPFFTTKPVGEGTGLGLSLSWGIVSEHGGWIEARSEPGRGSCFTLVLPGTDARA